MVGIVNEPVVELEKGKVNFGPLLIGGKAKETLLLLNQEHIPFAFHFDKSTIQGEEAYGDSLNVNPVSGIIEPNSQVPIDITFSPKTEMEYNYNLICNIKRKNRPLVLNIKGIGYTIKHKVFVETTPIIHLEPCNLNFE